MVRGPAAPPAGCTHFFWADHDDLYLRDHVAAGLAELADWDFSVSRRAGLLYTRADRWRFEPATEFSVHAPGGVSASMCFTRAFAEELLRDLLGDSRTVHADQIVAQVTMPKFRCLVSARHTCIYHSHEGSLTSREWVRKAALVQAGEGTGDQRPSRGSCSRSSAQ